MLCSKSLPVKYMYLNRELFCVVALSDALRQHIQPQSLAFTFILADCYRIVSELPCSATKNSTVKKGLILTPSGSVTSLAKLPCLEFSKSSSHGDESPAHSSTPPFAAVSSELPGSASQQPLPAYSEVSQLHNSVKESSAMQLCPCPPAGHGAEVKN